jgi:hypothetical protein
MKHLKPFFESTSYSKISKEKCDELENRLKKSFSSEYGHEQMSPEEIETSNKLINGLKLKENTLSYLIYNNAYYWRPVKTLIDPTIWYPIYGIYFEVSHPHIDFDKISVCINKRPDEWFIVRWSTWEYNHTYISNFYQCDGIDGLIECLKDLITKYKL